MQVSSAPPNTQLRCQLKQFKLQDGVLHRYIYYVDGNKWVPVILRSLQREVLEAFYDDTTAGHLGFHKTYDKIRSRCTWSGLSSTVAKYVTSCSLCQSRKRPAPAGLLQPLPCPASPFEVVGIDLYGPLPKTSNGNRWIVTAVDHLTRYAERATPHSHSNLVPPLRLPIPFRLISFYDTEPRTFSSATVARPSYRLFLPKFCVPPTPSTRPPRATIRRPTA